MSEGAGDRLDRIIDRIKRRHNYRIEWGPNTMQWVRMLKAEGLKETFDSGSYYEKSVAALASAFRKVEKRIFPEERIVGWMPDVDDATLRAREEEFWREEGLYARDIKEWGLWNGSLNHLALDYRRALQTGLGAVHRQVCDNLQRLDPADPDHIERIEFFKGRSPASAPRCRGSRPNRSTRRSRPSTSSTWAASSTSRAWRLSGARTATWPRICRRTSIKAG